MVLNCEYLDEPSDHFVLWYQAHTAQEWSRNIGNNSCSMYGKNQAHWKSTWTSCCIYTFMYSSRRIIKLPFTLQYFEPKEIITKSSSFIKFDAVITGEGLGVYEERKRAQQRFAGRSHRVVNPFTLFLWLDRSLPTCKQPLPPPIAIEEVECISF